MNTLITEYLRKLAFQCIVHVISRDAHTAVQVTGNLLKLRDFFVNNDTKLTYLSTTYIKSPSSLFRRKKVCDTLISNYLLQN